MPSHLTPPGSSEIERLMKAATAARIAGDHLKATSYFEQMADILSRNPANARLARNASAWANLSRGNSLLQRAAQQYSAKLSFEAAHKAFLELNDRLGAMRAEAMLLICSAILDTQDSEFDSAIESYAKAKGILSMLADRIPQEASQFRLGCLEIDMEIGVADLMDDATDNDFDGARSALADVQRTYKAMLPHINNADWKVGYSSYVLLAEALISYIRGKAGVARFKFDDATRFLQEADSKATEAAMTLSAVSNKREKWEANKQLYLGIAADCKAAIRHCEVYDSIISGRFHESPKRLREVAKLYHAASDYFANAGALGYPGLYVTAGERDVLNALADAVEGKIGKEFETVPDFASFVSQPALSALLARDYQEVLSAFHVSAWKLCMVGVGSILEALLLDRLQAKWGQVVTSCKLSASATAVQAGGWKLEEMISNAETSGIISKGNKYISDALRDHRNLVHPAKEIRSKDNIGAAEAVASIRALHRVMQDLKRP